jgi:16S rRNA (uracil1498-N3)-methyltransferase
LIIIGPEGGISENELAKLTSAGGKTIKLGRPVLRSAHAGLAAVSAVSALMKVW